MVSYFRQAHSSDFVRGPTGSPVSWSCTGGCGWSGRGRYYQCRTHRVENVGIYIFSHEIVVCLFVYTCISYGENLYPVDRTSTVMGALTFHGHGPHDFSAVNEGTSRMSSRR